MRTKMRYLTAATFAVAAIGLAAQAQQPRGGRGGMGGGMGGPAQIVASPAVQDEIKLTDDQKAKLKDWGKDYMAKAMEKMKDLRDLSPEERTTKMAEMNKDVYKELATVLDEKQVKRVKQISYQAQGMRAFSSPEVQDAVKLTDDQKAKVKDIADEQQKDMRELFSGGRPDQTKMAALQKEGMEKVTKVLTDDQQKAWKDLTGEPFDTSKLTGGFGGGAGGRRPGGNNKDKN